MIVIGPEVSGTDHFAPCQVGLGGQGGEGNPSDVSTTVGFAQADGVPFVLGGEQSGVSEDGAGDGTAGQLFDFLSEDVHSLAVPVSAGSVSGEDQVDLGVVSSSGAFGLSSSFGLGRGSGGLGSGSLGFSGSFGSAAGSQADNHDQSENQGNQFFHFCSSLKLSHQALSGNNDFLGWLTYQPKKYLRMIFSTA